MTEILVKVQIELSDSTKAFVQGLFSRTESTKPVETAKAIAEQKPTETAKAVVDPQPTTKAVATQKATSAVTIEEVRRLLATKVNDHRSAIKTKLTELGAANVTTLAEEKYDAFYGYLKSLEDAK